MTGVRLLADTRPLREFPAYRRLWAGSAASSVGGAMTYFAVILQVYRLTHSSAAVGALGLAVAVPTIGLGLFGGSIADAVDRRTLVLVTSSGLALVSAALAAQAFAGLRQLWLLYALVAVQALLAAVDTPARRTFVPRLLPAAQVPAGVALTQLSFQLSLVAGPALGGLVSAVGGLRTCYLIDALSFGAALYAVARLPAMPVEGGAARPGVAAVADGLRFVRRSRLLTGVFLADANAMVLGMPFALLPAVNADQFGGGGRTLGLLAAAPGVGGLVGSVFSGPVGHVSRPGRAMLVAVTVWGAVVAGFGLSRSLPLTLVLLALAGAADTTSVVFRGTIVQTATPDRLRGRVGAADYVVGLAGPHLGNVRAGVVGSLTSPAVSALSGGVATVVGASLVAVAVPALARYDARSATDTLASDTGRHDTAGRQGEERAHDRAAARRPG